MHFSRRDFLVLTAAGAAAGFARPDFRRLKLTTVGQALICRDIATQSPESFDQMRAQLQKADVAFTNLELAVSGPLTAGHDPQAEHGVHADASVLDCLRGLGFDLLSLANNHADDLGEAGFLSSIHEAEKRGFTVAGTGRTLAEAARPACLEGAYGRVALIAMASNAVPEHAMATPTRVGVNHVAQEGGVVAAADRTRVLEAISAAEKEADWVVVYMHDHDRYWRPLREREKPPEWKQRWCRECIDAGGTIFVSHGVPLLSGIELYNNRPIFYGLGNFVFQLAIVRGELPEHYQNPFPFQSVIAECDFVDREVRKIGLTPITLQSEQGVGEGGHKRHGNPRLAEGPEAAEILTRLAKLSAEYGTKLEVAGDKAYVSV